MLGVALAFLIPLGALLYRMRGGLGGDWIKAHVYSGWGATCGRLLWITPTASLLSVGAPWWVFLGLFPLLWIGVALGWGSYMDLGRNAYGYSDAPELPLDPLLQVLFGRPEPAWTARKRWLRDFVGMTLRGGIETMPAGVLLMYCGASPVFALAGFSKGVIYEIGWRLPSRTVGLETGVPLAELMFGATLWTIAVLMLLT